MRCQSLSTCLQQWSWWQLPLSTGEREGWCDSRRWWIVGGRNKACSGRVNLDPLAVWAPHSSREKRSMSPDYVKKGSVRPVWASLGPWLLNRALQVGPVWSKSDVGQGVAYLTNVCPPLIYFFSFSFFFLYFHSHIKLHIPSCVLPYKIINYNK